MRFEPFAIMLHRRYREGETIRQLAVAFGIPEDRVAQRIRAAAIHVERQNASEDALGSDDTAGTPA